LIFIAIFFISLTIPALKISDDKYSARENRSLAEWKPLFMGNHEINYDFGKNFNDWFNDRFNLRESFVELFNFLIFEKGKRFDNGLFDPDTGFMYKINELKYLDRNQAKEIFKILYQFDSWCKKTISSFIFLSPHQNLKYTKWHISLSTWFKEYVYIPLGCNRVSQSKILRNLIIVFLLTGIWHGAEWTFVIWGIWHGLFIVLEKILNIKKYDEQKHSWLTSIFRHLYCILVFIIGWVIFRAVNLKYAINYLMNMFGLLELEPGKFLYKTSYYLGSMEILVFIIALVCSTPIFKNILEINYKPQKALMNLWLLVLFFLSTISIAASTYNPFIYFRF